MLQNLEAGYTTMYNVKADACYQYPVNNMFINHAMTMGSVAGDCARNAGFQVKGATHTQPGEYMGHHYSVEVTEYTHAGLQELCDGSDCNQMFLQDLCDGSDCNQMFLQNLCDGSDCNQMFLQDLCDGSDCNQMSWMQELYQSQNLTHWVIEGKCYQKAVPANIMQQVLSAPINGLAGGCVVGGYT